MVQNFDGEKYYEFDEFPAIRQYFPYQNFHLARYVLLVNLWQSGYTQSKITISEALKSLVVLGVASSFAQGSQYSSQFLIYSRELCLLLHPIHLYKCIAK